MSGISRGHLRYCYLCLRIMQTGWVIVQGRIVDLVGWQVSVVKLSCVASQHGPAKNISAYWKTCGEGVISIPCSDPAR